MIISRKGHCRTILCLFIFFSPKISSLIFKQDRRYILNKRQYFPGQGVKTPDVRCLLLHKSQSCS